MSVAIRRLDAPDTFEVELAALAAEGLLGRARRLLGEAEEPEITPEAVGRALRAVMRACRQRDVSGRPLVWNAYTLFLAEDDRDRLRPLEALLTRGLLAAMEEERARLGAGMVGSPALRLLCDPSAPLAPGRIVIRARFEPDREELPLPRPGELTVRSPEPAPAVEPTRRVPETPAGALRLRWGGAEATLGLGLTRLGRPHPDAPAGFLPLTGADSRVNRVQLALDVAADQVTILRPPEANPVVVDGALIPPGGRLVIQHLPVRVSLSGDALTLVLERA